MTANRFTVRHAFFFLVQHVHCVYSLNHISTSLHANVVILGTLFSWHLSIGPFRSNWSTDKSVFSLTQSLFFLNICPRNTNRKAQYLSKGSRLGFGKMDWAISSPKRESTCGLDQKRITIVPSRVQENKNDNIYKYLNICFSHF
jgi:hypothetical protein